MRVVFITAEMVPFAKTGGLADVCAALPAEISQQGHTVKVIIPFYKMVRDNNLPMIVKCPHLYVAVSNVTYHVRVISIMLPHGVEVLCVDVPDLFNRDGLYGTAEGDYRDNDIRFVLFQKACFALLKEINFSPDIMHCHDWQTGLIPVYLKTVYHTDRFFKNVRSIFTIHNLAYQGIFPSRILKLANIPEAEFTADKLEFYGNVSCMKAGLVYADLITTVSKRYSEEIQTPEFGCGLEGVLQQRHADVYGIVNGLDIDVWNPETDPDLTITFKPNNWERKKANKGILQKESALDVNPNVLLIGIITRLADQKGLDILAQIMDALSQIDIQFVLLGTGDQKYNELFAALAKKHAKKFAANICFDTQMAKRIYAGADVFLMPSRYEPCGLGQMIALRYGTVPLVRETGGLADTVTNYDEGSGQGNGITFRDYTPQALLQGIQRAMRFYKDKKAWRAIIANGMNADFSWAQSAKQYIELYRNVTKKEVR